MFVNTSYNTNILREIIKSDIVWRCVSVWMCVIRLLYLYVNTNFTFTDWPMIKIFSTEFLCYASFFLLIHFYSILRAFIPFDVVGYFFPGLRFLFRNKPTRLQCEHFTTQNQRFWINQWIISWKDVAINNVIISVTVKFVSKIDDSKNNACNP